MLWPTQLHRKHVLWIRFHVPCALLQFSPGANAEKFFCQSFAMFGRGVWYTF